MKKFLALLLAFELLVGISIFGMSINNRPTVSSSSEPTVLGGSNLQKDFSNAKHSSESRTPETVDLSELSPPYGNKPATSVDEVVNNVYNYIVEYEIHPSADQDYAALQSEEMNNIFLVYSKAIENGKPSISLTSQELTNLQNYMIGTALPYMYSSPEFEDMDYRESTALYVLPYKVQYVYIDADDTEYSILIDYENNLFLCNVQGRIKVVT